MTSRSCSIQRRAKRQVGKNSFWWWGIGGTWFWIDPTNDIVAIGIIQRRGGVPGAANHEDISRRVVYEALTKDRVSWGQASKFSEPLSWGQARRFRCNAGSATAAIRAVSSATPRKAWIFFAWARGSASTCE